MTFVPIGEAIKRGAQRGPARGIFLSLRVERVLNEILPKLLPSIASEIKMHSYREGKLTLLTSSPLISQEIYLNSAVLLKKLNTFLGEKVIEKIGFKPNLPLS